MTKIQRNTQKIFAGKGTNDPIAVFGSMKTGNPIYTDNIEDLQSTAYENGWADAIVADEAPFLEEMNGVQYGFSKQIAYLFQEGIPEYDTGTTYYIGSIIKNLEENKVVLYQSIVDNNIGNPLTDNTKWQKVELGGGNTGGFNMFDIVIKDHILSFEESEGFALQGTYVYKTGVAGTRYGYPDFVQKCIDEKTAGTSSQVTLGASTITMYTNSNGHIFYDIADKAAVDTWFNTWGVADFYGVDTENERIFLPRNNKFMQFTTDTSKVNGFNEPGLPPITGEMNSVIFAAQTQEFSGCFSKEWNTQYWDSNKGDSYVGNQVKIRFDASNSSPVYGNSDTVQVASSNKLLYYVVGNTEVTSAETNVVDITSSENDIFPLLHHISADEQLNHPAWLQSSGQWNSGNIYTTAYNYLVNEYNLGQEHTDTLKSSNDTTYTVTYKSLHGKKIVNVSNINQVEAVYNAIGSAWYYVIDQDNMRFKLPQSHNYECYTSDSTRLGLDVSAGLPPITGSFRTKGANTNHTGCIELSNIDPGVTPLGGDKDQGFDVNINASLSSPVYGNSDTVTPAHTEFYLYFKVGNALQNQELIDIGAVNSEITEINSDIADLNTYTVFTYVSKTLHSNHSFPVNTTDAGTLYTFDLSDYLPAGNDCYEVSIDFEANNSSWVIARAFSNVKPLYNKLLIKGANPTGTNNTAIVGPDKQLTIGITSTQAGVDWINLRGYRKVKIG